MRDLIVFAIVILLLPTCIRRPFVGLLVFSWLAYMRPQDLCWGFARSMRLSFFVGIAMVAGWWAHERGRRPFAVWDARMVMVCALGSFVTVSYAMAEHHDGYTNTYFFEYVKIILIALFTTAQVDSKARLRVMFWTIALSLGFFGIKNGLLGVLRGGGQILRGPGGMLEDNNDFALAMVMNLPLLWYLRHAEHKLWIRRAMLAAVALTAVTVVLTHSRGGFLAMCATAMWIAWRSGHLVRALGVLVVLGALFPLLAPAEVLERLASIGDTKESSANARLFAWATALQMIKDNPLWGVGMRNFKPRYQEYSVVPITDPNHSYVAHNSYLQIWAESGSFAFITYLLLLAAVFVGCRWVFQVGRQRADLAWAANYARMMEATTIGFMVGAFFLNRGHFDLVYHWLALVTALVMVTRRAVARGPQTTAQSKGRRQVTVRWGTGAAPVAAATGALVVVRPRWR
ncbi:MAG: putative O-glycosylation ligase, exosortase A system-associated [Planctomycetes bacterium]|jgi:probable O-glycosylation ligase (exosortase A-associated)|nr:putative O-glycosylation ligase, exosortase A system-associated [Planctomycetota bacterium]